MRRYFLVVWSMAAANLLLATQITVSQEIKKLENSNLAKNPSENVDVFNPLNSLQFWICVITVALGVLVLIGQYALLNKSKDITSDDIVKNSTITTVLIGAIILIVAGYSSQQTAQAFGLFGTVVGYLLGRSASKQNGKD